MSLKAVGFLWESPPSQCLAGCDGSDYQDLIVTKCCHVFCKACIKISVDAKQKCPNCRTRIESAELEKTLGEDGSFNLCFEKFTYYLCQDLSILQEKAKTEKVALKILRYQALEKKIDKSDNWCPVCFEVPIPSHLYFIVKDKEPSQVGRYMHENCLESKVDNDSSILDIEINDLVKVASKLPWPPKQPEQKPSQPTSPIIIFFAAILLPMSLWALAMNSRIYHNKSAVFFVLSIPALVILQIFSLILSGLKAVFKDKHAIS